MGEIVKSYGVIMEYYSILRSITLLVDYSGLRCNLGLQIIMIY
jgi:hypothetical protein